MRKEGSGWLFSKHLRAVAGGLLAQKTVDHTHLCRVPVFTERIASQFATSAQSGACVEVLRGFMGK